MSGGNVRSAKRLHRAVPGVRGSADWPDRGGRASTKEAGMADSVLFIGWGENIAGREERGLEVFNEAVGMYGRMQQDGRIEKFDVGLLSPHGGGLRGFILLHGTADQLAAVENDPEYRRNLVDANMIVRELGAVRGWVNEGIADQMAALPGGHRARPQAS